MYNEYYFLAKVYDNEVFSNVNSILKKGDYLRDYKSITFLVNNESLFITLGQKKSKISTLKDNVLEIEDILELSKEVQNFAKTSINKEYWYVLADLINENINKKRAS